MRFLVVIWFFAVAHAQVGYNYQPSASAPVQSYADPAYDDVAVNVPAASESAPSFSAPAGFDKDFYSFSANDGDFLEPAGSNQVDNLLNEHLQVVFIKGPEHNGLEDAAAALAQQASQQRTAIYVLNKQADLSDLAGKLKNLGSQPEPEVHFVKYRTPEDAANAQQAIQSQYDQLGGDSHAHNGGAASTINFASAPAPVHQAAPSAPAASYLPSSVFKRLRL